MADYLYRHHKVRDAYSIGRTLGTTALLDRIAEEHGLKLDEVNVAAKWNPKATDWDEQGGFNFSNEKNILRWHARGDTLYDVIIPEGEEVLDVRNSKTPHGIFRAGKIIVTNPRKMTDELAMELYKKSAMPELTYYKTMAAMAMKGFKETCLQLIRDRVTKENVDVVISEYEDFNRPGHSEGMNEEVYYGILDVLKEIQSDLLISIPIDKEPYEKDLTDDAVINLTGQSGSGKSTYARKYNPEEYVIVDTDDIFNEDRFHHATGINHELGQMFREKYETMPTLGNDFDLIYQDILDYCKRYDKPIVIDCAQFHCVKEPSILKGKMVIMRTSIDNCYQRCLNRYQKEHPNCKIVFVGPCSAKKLEASRKAVRSDVDFVLTFEELMGLFEAKEVDFNTLESKPLKNETTADGRGFAVAGGVAQAVVNVCKKMAPEREIKVKATQGLRNCKAMLEDAKKGKYDGYLLEGMACPYGCASGAGTITQPTKTKALVGVSQRETPLKNSLESVYSDRLEELEERGV